MDFNRLPVGFFFSVPGKYVTTLINVCAIFPSYTNKRSYIHFTLNLLFEIQHVCTTDFTSLFRLEMASK